MKHIFFIGLILVMTVSSSAQWSLDKLDNNTLVHFSVGIGTGNAAGIFGTNPKQRILFGAVSATAIGVIKEVYDNKKNSQYSQVQDVIATTVGGVVGSVMVNWAIKRNEHHKEKIKYKYKRCKM